MGTLQPGRDGYVGRYLRTNEKVWTPPAVITFDTETRRIEREDGEDQPLRLWCARLDDRRKIRGGEPATYRARGHTGQQLAEVIHGWTRRRENVWLYCHNLGFDLITSALIDYLAVLGWTVHKCSTVPDYIFITVGNARRRVTMTDLHHYLPARLEDIGKLQDVHKTGQPAPDADDEEWFAYCAQDTDVLATAILALMEHWDTYSLGNWSLSGASCGFRAMRHMVPKKSITIIEDPAASPNERNAIYGGRRYCWRHGELPPGRYSELDFTAAHATVAANYPLPVKRGTWFNTLDPHHYAINQQYAIAIAECEVETDLPRFPCRINGKVWYPTGRFRTVLASPEIAWARDLGCLISIGRGQFHYTSWAMRPFFRRLLETSDPDNDQYPPIARAMWKQWGRSVIGKFAQRGYDLKDTRMLTDRNWYYERATDYETGEEYWLVHYDGRIWSAKPSGDGASAYPAVLAFVESIERVAIGQAAEMLGPRVVVQCDTDGLWADVGALESGAAAGLPVQLEDMTRGLRVDLAVGLVNERLGPLQLREKHNVSKLAMWGPQNYDAGPHTKHSGRPGRLREIEPGVWAGETFPKIARQMAIGDTGVFHTELVSWTRPSCAVPGWVTTGGTVLPIQVTAGPDGTPQILPYHSTTHHAAGHKLAAVQNMALTGYWDPAADYVHKADNDTKPPSPKDVSRRTRGRPERTAKHIQQALPDMPQV